MSHDGQSIGSYRVVRKLGEGGMGEVFEAVHRSIGRRAAIKVLRRGLAGNPAIAGRFVNEARAVNRVAHPGLVEIHEIGTLDDGRAFIVMELLGGESLAARLSRTGGRLVADAAVVGRAVANALAAAHDKGIVHRDLKPDNVMLVPDAERPGVERVKVLDFGVAKLDPHDDDEMEGVVRHTRTGATLGTPAYMAPEQCEGASAVDDRADVYSLGVMLYEMIAGRRPFHADSHLELMMMHLRQAPTSLKQLVPGIPDQMAGLVHRALAKQAVDRPPMREIAERLRGLEDAMRAMPVDSLPDLSAVGGGATAPDSSVAAPAVGRAGPRSRRAWMPFAVAAAAALGGAGWLVIRSATRAEDPAGVTRLPAPAVEAMPAPAHPAIAPVAAPARRAVDPAPPTAAPPPPAASAPHAPPGPRTTRSTTAAGSRSRSATSAPILTRQSAPSPSLPAATPPNEEAPLRFPDKEPPARAR